MLPSIELPNRQPVARSQSHRSAVCITATNVARLDIAPGERTFLTALARYSAIARPRGAGVVHKVVSLAVWLPSQCRRPDDTQ